LYILKIKLNKTDKLGITQYIDALVQPLLHWKSNMYYTFRVCVCSLWHPACNAHAPYSIFIWSLPSRQYFTHYLKKRQDFRKKRYWA